ncbi:MAG: hypothetical protein AB8C13_03335 [Phycisphaerales bacterium]
MHKFWRNSLIGSSLCAVVAGGLCACSGAGKTNKPSSAEVFEDLDTQIVLGSEPGSLQRGIELRVITADDSQSRVGRSLGKYSGAGEGSIDPVDQERWNSWGLRWVVVPVSELDAFIASQDLTNAIEKKWMGEFHQWRSVLRTGEIRNAPVRIGPSSASMYRTLSGRPQMIARVWTTPQVTPDGVQALLHLDLGIQMTTPRSAIAQWAEPKLPSVFDDGPLIEELTLSQVLDSSSALVLVGEDPDIVWTQQEQNDEILIEETGPASAQQIGPASPAPRSLGQRMLSTSGTGFIAPGMRYVPPKKVVIILIPRAGGAYRLLGPTTNSASSPIFDSTAIDAAYASSQRTGTRIRP